MEDISSFPPPPTPSSPLTSPETGRRGLHTSAALWNNSDRIKKSSGVGVNNKMVSFVGFLNVMRLLCDILATREGESSTSFTD